MVLGVSKNVATDKKKKKKSVKVPVEFESMITPLSNHIPFCDRPSLTICKGTGGGVIIQMSSKQPEMALNNTI